MVLLNVAQVCTCANTQTYELYKINMGNNVLIYQVL